MSTLFSWGLPLYTVNEGSMDFCNIYHHCSLFGVLTILFLQIRCPICFCYMYFLCFAVYLTNFYFHQ
jgi:hypothetical protein